MFVHIYIYTHNITYIRTSIHAYIHKYIHTLYISMYVLCVYIHRCKSTAVKVLQPYSSIVSKSHHCHCWQAALLLLHTSLQSPLLLLRKGLGCKHPFSETPPPLLLHHRPCFCFSDDKQRPLLSWACSTEELLARPAAMVRQKNY